MSWGDDAGMRPVEVEDCRAHRLSTSGRALLVWCKGTQETHWIAVSQIHPESQIQEPGDEGVLIVPQWLGAKEFDVYE